MKEDFPAVGGSYTRPAPGEPFVRDDANSSALASAAPNIPAATAEPVDAPSEVTASKSATPVARKAK